jgi:hypothetical protein
MRTRSYRNRTTRNEFKIHKERNMKKIKFSIIVAGGLAAATLGLAGHAVADSGDDNTGSYLSNAGSYSFVGTPTTYASPAANYVPWASWVEEGNNNEHQWQALVSTVANP